MNNPVEPQNDSQPVQSQTQTPVQPKMTQLILIFAFTLSLAMYTIVCFLMKDSRKPTMSAPPQQLELVFLVMALSLLAFSVVWLPWRTGQRGKGLTGPDAGSPMTPGEFQTELIVSLALAESAAIFGLVQFFMGASLSTFLMYAAGTFAVNVFVLLPRTLAYWNSGEDAHR